MTIFLVGGGSGGPTAPLLAVAYELLREKPKAELFFIGTKKGIEKRLISSSHLPINFLTIPAGKWRRYFSLMNFMDLFKIFAGFIKSWRLIKKHKPDIIFGAGSYVQVPVAYAAYLANVPVVIHQQDLEILFSTRLVSAIASAITVSFPGNTKNFSESTGLFREKHKSKIFYTGNPVRNNILSGDAEKARSIFRLNSDFPTILIMGGGTGAAELNRIVKEALHGLLKYAQVIHITGGKTNGAIEHPHYHSYDFLGDELKHAYAVSDLVISRAGLSTISEIARLGKAAVLVPLPASPQMNNARYMALLQAAICIPQKFLTPPALIKLIRELLWDKKTTDMLKMNVAKIMPKNAAYEIAQIIIKSMRDK